MTEIKETHEKTFDELNDQIKHQESLCRAHLTDKVNSITADIDDLFKEFTIQVTSTDINFKLTIDPWFDFRISRSLTYNIDDFGKPTISTSSVNGESEKSLKKMICVGILAQHCLIETNKWNELVSLMDECNEIYKRDINPLYSQIFQIETELRKIKAAEQNKEFNNLFSKGTFKLNKQIDFYYGSGKWDRVHSDEWFWEANESGKTYTISYNDNCRMNGHYDADGNSIEGIFEIKKRVIDKRIKKADIESFVKYNRSLIDKK
jgi:hypothetical protein